MSKESRRDRKILHCDMNSFYASVELLAYPELRDRPVAVAGDPERRHGIILAKNEAAKKYGVVTAETVGSAMKKCPGLVLLPPHHEKYSFYSRKINEIYRRYTDLVEPFSIDESWLDVTGSGSLFGDAKTIADDIRREVRERYGLTLSVGVSFNKIFAKMGSEYKKPDATTVISRDNFRDILWPLPVGDFFYVGKATERRLTSIGIETVGDLAAADPSSLQSLLGVHGLKLHKYANGLDDSPVASCNFKDDIKSIGHGITFRRDLKGADDISFATSELSEMVSARLRAYKKKARGVKVEVTDPYFSKVSRQKRLPAPVNTTSAIKKAATSLVNELGYGDRPIRLLTITAIDLTDELSSEQVSIFSVRNETDERLDRTLDEIRSRFGDSAIHFAHSLDNDFGITIDRNADRDHHPGWMPHKDEDL